MQNPKKHKARTRYELTRSEDPGGWALFTFPQFEQKAPLCADWPARWRMSPTL